MKLKTRLAPCLWFDGQAEQAAAFYTGIFPDSRIVATSYYPEAGREIHGHDVGSVLTVEFELNGVHFTALNGGPQFRFSEAISFQIACDTQEDIDRYWDALVDGGGSEQPCGWLKDRFGVSWQVVPVEMWDWITGDPGTMERVMKVMMPMQKLDLAALRRAAQG